MAMSELDVKIGVLRGFTEPDPDWSVDASRRRSGDQDLWTVLAGAGRLVASEGVFDVRPGDCFVFRGGTRYTATPDPKSPPFIAYIHYEYVDGNGDIVKLPPRELPKFHRNLADLSFAEKILRGIITLSRGNLDEQREANTWLKAFLLKIVRDDRMAEMSRVAVEQRRHIEDLCARITRQPARDFRLADMAREMHYSVGHFSRVFREAKGVSPREFVIRNRIDNAKMRLRWSRDSVSQIAASLGYRDVFFFSKQFRAKTGLTPTQYRTGG